MARQISFFYEDMCAILWKLYSAQWNWNDFESMPMHSLIFQLLDAGHWFKVSVWVDCILLAVRKLWEPLRTLVQICWWLIFILYIMIALMTVWLTCLLFQRMLFEKFSELLKNPLHHLAWIWAKVNAIGDGSSSL